MGNFASNLVPGVGVGIIEVSSRAGNYGVEPQFVGDWLERNNLSKLKPQGNKTKRVAYSFYFRSIYFVKRHVNCPGGGNCLFLCAWV